MTEALSIIECHLLSLHANDTVELVCEVSLFRCPLSIYCDVIRGALWEDEILQHPMRLIPQLISFGLTDLSEYSTVCSR